MRLEDNTQQRVVHCESGDITYLLTRKAVKNINLRVKPDGTVRVSANNRVPVKLIDGFIEEKQQFILAALAQYEEKKNFVQDAPERYDVTVFDELIKETYARFQKYGVPYPQLKIRNMSSRWGSCQPQKGIITLNRQLLKYPRECIEYVVVHEFTHFIHPNHSKQFWDFVTMMMPDWKERKAKLNQL
jgi:predicted metal-dependent hydrolase